MKSSSSTFAKIHLELYFNSTLHIYFKKQIALRIVNLTIGHHNVNHSAPLGIRPAAHSPHPLRWAFALRHIARGAVVSFEFQFQFPQGECPAEHTYSQYTVQRSTFKSARRTITAPLGIRPAAHSPQRGGSLEFQF
jgi:hypothetical protein